MADAIEEDQPHRDDVGDIGSEWICKHFRTSKHPPTHEAVIGEKRKRGCGDNNHQHNNGLLSRF